MSSLPSGAAPAALTADDVERLVGKLAGRRMVEQVLYFEDRDVVAVQSEHFAVLIDRGFIDELRGLSPKKLKDLKVSAAGTTIELEGSDIHIEVAGLLVDYLNHLRAARAGGPMLELLEGRVAAG
jgi:hypothetical protein